MIVSHRANAPSFKRHGQYKPYLREDFYYSCAYCLAHEAHVGDLWAMTVDHFKPKKRFPKLAASYRNLYYACCQCNTYKGDTWPTADDRRNGTRFIDTCIEHHEEHIGYRDCLAFALTTIGNYSIQHLRLNRRSLVARREKLSKLVGDELTDMSKLQHLIGLVPKTSTDAEANEILESLRELQKSCFMRLIAFCHPSPLDG